MTSEIKQKLSGYLNFVLLCIENDELCIEKDELCVLKMMNFVLKMMNYGRSGMFGADGGMCELQYKCQPFC